MSKKVKKNRSKKRKDPKKNDDDQMPMHVIEFPIYDVEGYVFPRQAFDKRFGIINHIHNVMVKEAHRRLDRLNENKLYRALRSKYGHMKENGASEEELKKFAKDSGLNKMPGSYGLTKNDFEKYLKKCRNLFKDNITSMQGQKEAYNVWKACESVLYGNGRHIHFRKINDCHTISQKNTTNGIHGKLSTGEFEWCGIKFKAKIDWRDEYVTKALLKDEKLINKGLENLEQDDLNPICYYEIKRRMFPSGWRYYLKVVMEGHAPQKISTSARKGAAPGGVDPGTSTIAYASDKAVFLERLAPDAPRYEKMIHHYQKELDHLSRVNNPDNYKEDGTVKLGRHAWKDTARMRKLRRMIRSLHRQKADYVKQNQCIIANKIIRSCSKLTIEPNDFKKLQKRAKSTERSGKAVQIKKKDGTVQTVFKYKRKKRYGHSLFNNAPAQMVTILKAKCKQYSIPVQEVDTYKYKASQYDPVTGEYKKCSLSDRMKTIGGHLVQRDLLSAYVLSRPAAALDQADAESCAAGWDHFIKLHDTRIQTMKAEGISFKQCFGF